MYYAQHVGRDYVCVDRRAPRERACTIARAYTRLPHVHRYADIIQHTRVKLVVCCNLARRLCTRQTTIFAHDV